MTKKCNRDRRWRASPWKSISSFAGSSKRRSLTPFGRGSLFHAETVLIERLEAAGWRFADLKLATAAEFDAADFAGTHDWIKSRSWAAIRALNQARRGEPIDPPPPQYWAHLINGFEIFLERPLDAFDP
jgi:hypothetical protein